MHRAAVVLWVVVTGCAADGTDDGAAPPQVTGFAPAAAAYGDLVVIEGRGFGASRDDGAVLTVTAAGGEASQPFVPWRYDIDHWSDERIAIRAAFPLGGTIAIANEDGVAQVGAFEPTAWDPGPPAPIERLEVLAAVALDESRVAALAVEDDDSSVQGAPHLFVWDGDRVDDHVLDVPSIEEVLLVADAGGQPLGMLETVEGCFQLRWSAGAPVVEDTGLSANGVVAGADAAGLYLWQRASFPEEGVVRLRPPSWEPDVGPIPYPEGATPSPLATAAGILYAGEIEDDPDTIDGQTFRLYQLRPDATSFVEIQTLYGEEGVELLSIVAGADGETVGVQQCYAFLEYPWSVTPTRRCRRVAWVGGTWSGEAIDEDDEPFTFVPDPAGGIARVYPGNSDVALLRTIDGIAARVELGLYGLSRPTVYFTPSGEPRVVGHAHVLRGDELVDRSVYAPRPR